MTLYIILFTFSTVLALLDFTKIKQINKIGIGIIFSSLLVLLSGIRWKTGTDWDMYYYFFSASNTLNDFISNDVNNQGIEFGYGIVNYITKFIFGDYNFLLMIVSGVIIGVKCRLFFKYSPFFLVAIFANFSTYLGDIFFIRQNFALAMTLLSFDFILKKKKIHFCSFIFLAASIHTSALIFLPAYWIYYYRMTFKRMISVVAFFICISIFKFNTEILMWIMDIFSSEDGKIFQKLHAYYILNMQGKNFGQAIDSNTRIIIASLRRIVFLPVFLAVYRIKFWDNEMYTGILNLVIFGHLLFFFVSGIGMDFAGRLTLYYYIYEILLMTYIIKIGTGWIEKGIIFFIIFVYSFMKYFYLIYSLGEYYIPFNTFL